MLPPEFLQALEEALQYLYDPSRLMRSGLPQWLGPGAARGSPMDIQNLVCNAIEELRPDASTPPHANAWRYYHLLSQRYVELLPQDEMARNLSISPRQLRRIQAGAVEALGRLLSSRYGLTQPAIDHSTSDDLCCTRTAELSWVSRAFSVEPIDLGELTHSVVSTMARLAERRGILVSCGGIPTDAQVSAESSSLRHAILTIISGVIGQMTGHALNLRIVVRDYEASLEIEVQLPSSASDALQSELEVACELLRLSSGWLETTWGVAGRPTRFSLCLPLVGKTSVLVVDDNADALRLYERLLSGTRYRVVSVRDPHQAVPTALEVRPQAVLLDLMLPEIDGWELLSRLHQLPDLPRVPVIVCTILPEEDLAEALGAAGFLRKPINREGLVAALDAALASRDSRS